MNRISVKKFRYKLKAYIEQTVSECEPTKETRISGKYFIVNSAGYWESDKYLNIVCLVDNQSTLLRKVELFIYFRYW